MFRSFVTSMCLVLLTPMSARAVTFVIHPGNGSVVRFESKAPMESFEGKTEQVDGKIALDLDALEDSIAVTVKVNLASLSTGIALRDQHMRDNHLETAKYPIAVFRGGRISDRTRDRLDAGEKVGFDIDGVLELHGITRPLRAHVEMQHENSHGGTQLRIRGEFHVKLSDHDIPRPRFLVMKLSDDQLVRLDLIARPLNAP